MSWCLDNCLRTDNENLSITINSYARFLAYLPDGKTLASTGTTSIKFWDVANGNEIRRIRTHTLYTMDWIVSFALSPDGRTVACGNYDGTIDLWDMSKNKKTARLEKPGELVQSLVFSPCSRILVSASWGDVDNRIKVWDIARCKNTAAGVSQKMGFTSLAFRPDCKAVASGNDDKSIKLWDLDTGKELACFLGHKGIVTSIAFSPDGKMLASGSHDQTIKLWEVATGKERTTLHGHRGWIFSVAFSPDGAAVASASEDNTVKLWDAVTGNNSATLRGHSKSVFSVAFSPDGKMVASASEDETIKLWRTFNCKNSSSTQSRILSSKELDGLWRTLSGDDAKKAYQAINTLVLSPKQAIDLIQARLRPTVEPNTQEIQRLISELDSDQFAVREKATAGLENAVDVSESLLRKKLTEKPPLEVRRRIESLLSRIRHLSPESLRTLRALEVLEHIGNSESKRLLERLAHGAEHSYLTRESCASLHRLKYGKWWGKEMKSGVINIKDR